MRNTLVVAFLAFFASTATAVDYHWTKPGVYQVKSNQYGSAIGPGPYANKGICESTLPKSKPESYIEYECNYLAKDGLTDQ